ncbi:rab-GTPase-TBC domain-containing protein [Paraphoma chrysanthemicola]|nr:rab-GTPase-TBC domain-containing protein [Paraphoma chrysanthemicola]
MPSTLFQHPDAGESDTSDDGLHFISHNKHLYIISEHEYVHSLIPLPKRDACADEAAEQRIGTPLHQLTQRRHPRPLMTTFTYSQDAHSAFELPPGSPPDLTNSKSSKSSSFHSSTISDFMGPSDLTHFEDISLDETGGPPSFPMPLSTSNRVIFEASRPFPAGGRSVSHSHAAQHSFRDLTGAAKPKYPSLKGPVSHAVQRQQAQLTAPGKPLRRGFTSPSAPSLTSMGLAAPNRSSRSPSPSNPQKHPSAPRTLSRRSSRNMDVLPSPSLSSRRQSWQDSKRKTVKEREAECDDEDDELPEDAIIMNVPISPRPAQDRSPSACGSPPSPNPSTISAEPTSAKISPAPSLSRYSVQPSPNPSIRANSPPSELSRQRTNTWEDTYTHLDADARKLTEALEEFQSEFERKQEVQRQQPGLTRSASATQLQPKTKKTTLPPVRKSDPLIDPFQPSAEKQKYLSRTRPSWLPPKNPKEEKKHLREYQKMLARIEEAERLEAQRAQDEALAREKATRIKSEYWSSLLLPNWATEMTNPELRASHRKMWWNGIPPRLRGEVWQRAIANDLEVSEMTYNIALEKAQREIKQFGYEALGGRYAQIVEGSRSVWPELKMFGAKTSQEKDDEQPLHQDLVNVCLAYSTYRSDISHQSSGIHHIAALLLLNLPAPQAFSALSNLLNRPLPLSFLVQDPNAIHAAYSTTLHALSKKSPLLAQRLESLRVEPRDYLAGMFSSLFCGRLGVEHAARVMDVYVIESDKIPPRVAVAIMCIVEGSCVEGDAAQVARMLREKEIEMDVEEFMARVYEAGKSG